MDYFVLSDDEGNAAHQIKVAGSHKLSLNTPSIVDALASAAGSSCIIADLHLIDDVLARAINTAQRISGKAVGIIPFSAPYSGALARLLRPYHGDLPTEASYIAYSVDNEAISSLGCASSILGRVQLYASDQTTAVCKELAKGGSCFAAQINGRQTFCFLDSRACIHPDSFGQLEGTPGIITPKSCHVKHFLIQSCHSPFCWPDFGRYYLSVPLGFILRGSALTFITSTRVQSLVPDLIPLYISCANAGMSVGDILLELNQHCCALQIDEAPFLLFGHPDSRVVHRTPTAKYHFQTVDSALFDRYRSHLYALGSLLQNLRFSKDYILGLPASVLQLDPDIRSLVGNCGQHLRAIKRKGASASPEELRFQTNTAVSAKQLENSINRFGTREQVFSEQLDRVSRAFNAQTLRFRSPAAIAATPTTHTDLEAFTAALLRTGQKDALASLSRSLLDLWKQKHGYYYYFTDNVEHLFLPESSFLTDYCCPSCGSNLMSKPQRYVGLNPTESYQARQQLICPRCLMVRDASLAHSASLDCSFREHGDSLHIEISYRNQSRNPEWLFGYFHLNDPNNVSANMATDLFNRLLIGTSPISGDWEPRTIAPDEVWHGVISVEGICKDLFYLLVECHLFVGGCWNWLSFTRRKPHLDQWLESSEYLSSVPRSEK